jgi:large subunit ribosomal protein L20
MVRATNAVAVRRAKKRMFKAAKGFWGDRKNHNRQTQSALMKAMDFHTRHRKVKKRDYRKLWITRIQIGAKIHGISYSRLIDGLHKGQCVINRKMLADLAVRDSVGFGAVVQVAKEALV